MTRQEFITPALESGLVHPNAAAIDLGAQAHYVCVPADRAPEPVRHFGCFVSELEAMAQWLVGCGITTVALEATGVYWVPVVQVLWRFGLEPVLVDPRRLKYVPGRKSDVLDCQWMQQLHAHGLLAGAFLPPSEVAAWRSYTRQRQSLVDQAADEIRRMQKAFEQMGVQLHKVLTDLTGATGMAIVKAILDGQRDPQALAALRYAGCKRSEEDFVKALSGDWRAEHLFSLKQAFEHYEFLQGQLRACDQRIEAHLKALTPAQPEAEGTPLPASSKTSKRKPRKNEPRFDLRGELHRLLGVDLTQIDGLDALTVQAVLSECGLDLSAFQDVKHFCSWLGLCPGTRITGGKRKSGRSRPVAHRAATALRRAAQSLWHSDSALGAFFRRMKARLGPAAAITATAHKLARLLYFMLTRKQTYVDPGGEAYEQRHHDAAVKSLKRRAHTLGFQLLDLQTGEIIG